MKMITLNKVAMGLLSVFLITHALIHLLDLRHYYVLEGVGETCALICGVFGIVEVLWYTTQGPSTGHRNDRGLLILFAFLIIGSSSQAAVDPFEAERGKVAAAESIAMNMPIQSPQPNPNPPPSPGPSGTTCTRCNGTGIISPDGRIQIRCPDCGGDGKIDTQDITKAIGYLNGELERVKSSAVPGGIGVQQGERPPTPASEPAAHPLPVSNNVAPVSNGVQNPISVTVTPPGSTAVIPIRWFEDIDSWQAECKRTGIPGFIFWYGDSCSPCEVAKQQILGNSEVQNYLGNNFICCKINSSNQPVDMLQAWSVDTIPKFMLVKEDWSTQLVMKDPNTSDQNIDVQNPIRFLERLQNAHKQLYIHPGGNRIKMLTNTATPIMNAASYRSRSTCCSTDADGNCTCPDCNCNCKRNPETYVRQRSTIRYYPTMSCSVGGSGYRYGGGDSCPCCGCTCF